VLRLILADWHVRRLEDCNVRRLQQWVRKEAGGARLWVTRATL
jgi:hypothetical protein